MTDTEKVAFLESENTKLMHEKERLEKLLSEREDAHLKLTAALKDTKTAYAELADELSALRDKYRNTLGELCRIKEEYAEYVRKLLSE